MGYPKITCPAGEDFHPASGGVGCRCRIERTNLSPRENPRTLMAFCRGDYTACSTWRTMRETEWANRAEAKKLRREVEVSAKAAGEL